MANKIEIITEENTEKLNQMALEKLEYAIKAVLATKSQVTIGLPGGESFKNLFALLKHQTKLPWENIHLFMIDERLVTITSPESNYRVAHSEFISTLTEKEILPEENAHPFVIQEFKNQAKRSYETDIQNFGGAYDICLIGVGEDGHIASLFPNSKALEDPSEMMVLVNDSPKPPAERVSISKNMILKTKYAIVYFVGYGKGDAFAKFNDSKVKFEDCPVKLVKEIPQTWVFVDREYK